MSISRKAAQIVRSPCRAFFRSGGLHTIIVSYPGRIGYWRVGVPPSGPMDDFAFRAGNRLLGNNDKNTAGLEITYKGPIIEFNEDCAISLTGAKINGATLTNGSSGKEHNIADLWWKPIEISKGNILNLDSTIDTTNTGVRSYLNINNNGFIIDDYLGSKTSFPLGKFGGYQNKGAVLQSNDVLLYNPSDKNKFEGGNARQIPNDYFANGEEHIWNIGILIGPQSNDDFITQRDANTLYNSLFQVSHNASRLGIRLNIVKNDSVDSNSSDSSDTSDSGDSDSGSGSETDSDDYNWPEFSREDGGEGGSHPSNLIDNAYAIGAINFTGSHPVILTVDGPSLGGFVCPVTVPSHETWKIGQLKPNDIITFKVLDLQTSLKQKYGIEALLSSMQPSTSRNSGMRNADNNSNNNYIYDINSNGVEFNQDLWNKTKEEYANMDGKAVLHRIDEKTDSNGEINQPKVCYRMAGDKYILIEYGRDKLDLSIRVRIHKLEEMINKHLENNNGIIDTIPGVRSLLIEYDPFILSLPKLLNQLIAFESELTNIMNLKSNEIIIPTNLYKLPFVFNDEWTNGAIERYMNEVRNEAVYLPSNCQFVCENNGLSSIDELRDLMYDTTFCALGLGDVYLGAPCAVALDPRQRLNVPKYNPSRNFTPEGAVGLGGQYLCIYPMESPGGYQLVGRTLPIWDKDEAKPWYVMCHAL